MKNANQASKAKFSNDTNPITSGARRPTNHSSWFGPFSLFRSPLFVIMTLWVMVITILLITYTQNLEISILAGLTFELLISTMIWQYLLLSRRLESIQTHTADLQNTVKRSESKFAINFSDLESNLVESHRLLGEAGGELNKVLQSDKEMKEATTLFYEHLVNFFSHIENWQVQNLDHTKEVTQVMAAFRNNVFDQFKLLREDIHNSREEAVSETCKKLGGQISAANENQYMAIEQLIHQQIEQVNNNLNETLPNHLVSEIKNFSLDHSRQLATTLAHFAEQIAALKEITQIFAAFRNNAFDQFKHLREDIHNSREKAVSETCEKLGSQISAVKENQYMAIEQLIHQQIEQENNNLIEALPNQLVSEIKNLSLNHSRQLVTTLAQFEEQITALKVKDFEPGEEAGENATVKALEVATALDRLNLELRRQLSSLRQEFTSANLPIQ